MRRGIASATIVGGLVLALGGCGKYGPPRRAEPQSAGGPSAAPATPGAAPSAPAAPVDEPREEEPLGSGAPGSP